MNFPLVSIITPCYNADSYIAYTIESVLNQTYTNWEMLIIDDCSSDHSYDIIKSYLNRDNRIRYIKTTMPSGSPSTPRNIGIDNAIGELIAFLDADDIWLPKKLEWQIKFMTEQNCKFVYSNYEKMDWNGNRNNRAIYAQSKSTYNSLFKTNSIPCLTVILHKDLIGETRFKDIPQEDYCMWLDILKKNYIAYNIHQVTALYREARKSRSTNKISMFRGYWNVIRNHQHISFISSCIYMISYTIYGIIKYLK